MAITIRELRTEFTGDTRKLQAGARRASTAIRRFGIAARRTFARFRATLTRIGRVVGRWAKRLALAFAITVVLGIRKAINAFSELQRKVTEVGTLLLKWSSKVFHQIKGEAQDMAEAFGQTTEAMLGAKYDVVSAGFTSAAESAMVLTAGAKAATAGLVDAKTATNLIISALRGYQLKAKDATRASDILFTTVRLGRLTFADLAAHFGMVVNTAKAAGVSMNELGAAISTTTLSGIPVAVTFTALNRVIMSLVAPTEQSRQAFEAMGIETTDASGKMLKFRKVIEQFRGKSLADIRVLMGDIRSSRALLAMANNMELFTQHLTEFGKTSGAAEAAFKKMVGTVAFKQRQMKASWVRIFQDLGEAMEPAMMEIYESLRTTFKEISKWVRDNKDTIVEQFKIIYNAAKKWLGGVWDWLADAAKTGQMDKWVAEIKRGLIMVIGFAHGALLAIKAIYEHTAGIWERSKREGQADMAREHAREEKGRWQAAKLAQEKIAKGEHWLLDELRNAQKGRKKLSDEEIADLRHRWAWTQQQWQLHETYTGIRPFFDPNMWENMRGFQAETTRQFDQLIVRYKEQRSLAPEDVINELGRAMKTAADEIGGANKQLDKLEKGFTSLEDITNAIEAAMKKAGEIEVGTGIKDMMEGKDVDARLSAIKKAWDKFVAKTMSDIEQWREANKKATDERIAAVKQLTEAELKERTKAFKWEEKELSKSLKKMLAQREKYSEKVADLENERRDAIDEWESASFDVRLGKIEDAADKEQAMWERALTLKRQAFEAEQKGEYELAREYAIKSRDMLMGLAQEEGKKRRRMVTQYRDGKPLFAISQTVGGEVQNKAMQAARQMHEYRVTLFDKEIAQNKSKAADAGRQVDNLKNKVSALIRQAAALDLNVKNNFPALITAAEKLRDFLKQARSHAQGLGIALGGGGKAKMHGGGLVTSTGRKFLEAGEMVVPRNTVGDILSNLLGQSTARQMPAMAGAGGAGATNNYTNQEGNFSPNINVETQDVGGFRGYVEGKLAPMLYDLWKHGRARQPWRDR